MSRPQGVDGGRSSFFQLVFKDDKAQKLETAFSLLSVNSSVKHHSRDRKKNVKLTVSFAEL